MVGALMALLMLLFLSSFSRTELVDILRFALLELFTEAIAVSGKSGPSLTLVALQAVVISSPMDSRVRSAIASIADSREISRGISA